MPARLTLIDDTHPDSPAYGRDDRDGLSSRYYRAVVVGDDDAACVVDLPGDEILPDDPLSGESHTFLRHLDAVLSYHDEVYTGYVSTTEQKGGGVRITIRKDP